jgi:hypothetical protein
MLAARIIDVERACFNFHSKHGLIVEEPVR